MNFKTKTMMIFAVIAMISMVGITGQNAFASVGVPFASPTGGLFNSTQLVTLTSSDGINQIQYTTDGSDPTLGGTLVASGSTVSISSTTTLKFAETDGVIFSSVVTEVYTIDTTAPTLSPVHIQSNNANPAFAKVGDQITLTFTASETINTPTVTIFGNTVTASNTGGNDWSAQYTTTSGDTEGSVPFTIDFSDLAGNSGTQVTSTTDASDVDFIKTLPTSVINSPANGTITSSTTVNFSGLSNGINLASTEISVDGGALQPTSGTASNWTFSATGLSDGDHTFQTTATDQAGNAGQSSLVTITVNTSSPSVVINNPADNSFANSATVGIDGTASLGSGTITSVSYTLDGGASTPATGTSSWTISLSGLSDGSHTVIVSALGSNGLTGTATVHFTVDTVNPTTAISSPADNSITGSSTIALSGTSSDTNLNSTEISVDGGALQPTSGTASNWTFSATGLSDGSHTFQTTATDNAGNTATSSIVHVTVDTTVPTVHASPVGGNFNSAQSVTLTGSEAGTIYFTTDGSTPTTASQVYSGPIAISATTTLKFFEQNLGLISGGVSTEQYNINTALPTITLLGTNPQVLTQGSTYIEAGATAHDSLFGNLTGSIIIDSSSVNTNVIGNYTVTYDVTDAFANHVQVLRTVQVTAINHIFKEGGYASAVPSLAVPSLGGAGTIYKDGLTINGIPFDVSKHSQTINKQSFQIGKEIHMSVKQAPLYGSAKYQSTKVFLNFGGKDMETYNAQTVLSFDAKTGMNVVDPNGFMKNVKIGENIVDENIVKTEFYFTPAKQMPDTGLIIQSVDAYNRVNNAYVHGAIQFGIDAPVVEQKADPNVVTFNDIGTVKTWLQTNNYQRPNMLAHIHSSADMFGSTGGQVFWTVNTTTKTMTAHAVDSQGVETWTFTEALEEMTKHPIGNHSGTSVDAKSSGKFEPSWISGGAYNANAFKMPAGMR